MSEKHEASDSTLNRRVDTSHNPAMFSDAEMKRQREALRKDWEILLAWAAKKGKKIDLHRM